ncbi:MAG: putative nicotinate-nucleotide adenylyltransferase [Syntrophomonadaceae bacterium]|nr:putative nicotinate-nucleotide adenylyltransferase [Bacillota bacterium]
MSLHQTENTEQCLSVGLMGGTFDPIHLGHLLTAEEVRIQFGLEQVIFVPAGHPPHKNSRRISDQEHRYLMTVMATITNPYFSVSRFELERPPDRVSYTIDTVRYFYAIFGGKCKLYFISGADAILEILTWKDYRELLSICSFIAVTRPGYGLDKLTETFAVSCPEALPGIHILEIPAVAISSTLIRRRVAEGKSIKYMAPELVAQYIIKSGLYCSRDEDAV